MARITHDGLEVCVDCAQIIANGTDGVPELEAHALLIEAEWAGVPGHLVITDSGEDFTTRRCDGCGSDLAGERFRAAVIS